MENRGIVSIKVEQLYPHPDNPRKNIGDVTELSESMKKNGVMQNLTVIPISALSKEPDEQPEADDISLKSDFHVLIGHRRLAAAKLAGLSEVPCKIRSKISKKEQVGIMLEENMQREDLTICEQAQGFQMMLDLGETEDSIADKTGFSKTTIRHRLNIAKLDQEELQKKEQDVGFQLTLSDLYALEQVKDIKTRNKILREASNSQQLIWKAQNAAAEAERKKKMDAILKLMKSAGIEEAPKAAEKEQYGGKWEVVKEYSLETDAPKQLRLPKSKDKMYYLVWYRTVRVIKKTPQEVAREEREENKKKIKAMVREMNCRCKDFLQNLISGKIKPVKDDEDIREAVWKCFIEIGAYISESGIIEFFSGKPLYMCKGEEKEEAERKAAELNTTFRMLILLYEQIIDNINGLADYNGYCNKERCNNLLNAYAILEKYGWTFEDEEKQLLNGTHELYEKKEG